MSLNTCLADINSDLANSSTFTSQKKNKQKKAKRIEQWNPTKSWFYWNIDVVFILFETVVLCFWLPVFLGGFCVEIRPSKLIMTSEFLCDVDAGCVYPMSFDQGFTDIKNMSFKNKKNVVYLISGEAFLLTKNSYLCFAIDTCTWNHTLGGGYTEDGRPPLKMHADAGDRET